jgi:DNA modification methylase
VQCVVTSPPYWGLRAYGTEPQIWGGDPNCPHEWTDATYQRRSNDNKGNGTCKQLTNEGSIARDVPVENAFCSRCGAWRGELGLEPTPEMFVEHIVQVFREVRRVMRPDATCWVNLGDSYATGAGRVGNCPGGGQQGDNWKGAATSPNRLPLEGLKPKDLVGIPWRVAFALQADGWWLRSDIIWSKPNPMPESVTDRPTKAHEYLFLLAKSQRYYYDAEAIKEPQCEATLRHAPRVAIGPKGVDPRGNNGKASGATNDVGGRNKRSVWTVATQSFPEAHFATFPEALVEPCIKAGCPEDGIVLDPFAGSGTTLEVAQRLGRIGWGIELNAEYADIAARRLAQEVLPL